MPYGVLNEGHNNWITTNNVLPVAAGSPNPQNAANPADRDILSQANVRTVLISTGTDDLLANTPTGTIETELAAFAQQVRKYYADTSVNNTAGFITVYVATIPPDTRFTSGQEQAREAVNSYIQQQRAPHRDRENPAEHRPPRALASLNQDLRLQRTVDPAVSDAALTGVYVA